MSTVTLSCYPEHPAKFISLICRTAWRMNIDVRSIQYPAPDTKIELQITIEGSDDNVRDYRDVFEESLFLVEEKETD